MTPEQIVDLIDFRYIEDALTKEEALNILHEQVVTKGSRVQQVEEEGYPAYTTSAGWLGSSPPIRLIPFVDDQLFSRLNSTRHDIVASGYSDDKIRALIAEAKSQGFTHFKQKVGANLQDDIRRAALIRSVAGEDATLMMDANQVWGVQEAIDNMGELVKFRPLWIEGGDFCDPKKKSTKKTMVSID